MNFKVGHFKKVLVCSSQSESYSSHYPTMPNSKEDLFELGSQINCFGKLGQERSKRYIRIQRNGSSQF